MSEQVFASNDCVVASVKTGQNALVTLYFSARSSSSYLLSDWCPVLVSCKAGYGVGAYVPLKTTMAAPMVFRNWTLSCTADGYLLARITSLWPPQSLLWVQLGVNAAGSSLLFIECPCSFVGLNAGMQTILTSPTLDSLAAAPYNAAPLVQVFAAGLQDLGTAVDLSDGGAYSFYACASGSASSMTVSGTTQPGVPDSWTSSNPSVSMSSAIAPLFSVASQPMFPMSFTSTPGVGVDAAVGVQVKVNGVAVAVAESFSMQLFPSWVLGYVDSLLTVQAAEAPLTKLLWVQLALQNLSTH